jgi:hypothetical protein
LAPLSLAVALFEMTSSAELQKEVAAYANAHIGEAILASAIVEQSLEALLLSHMDVSNDVAEKLFDGALRSFLAKTKLAQKLNLISRVVITDLDLVRNVRNAFAHPRGPREFTSPTIIKCLRQRREWTDNLDAKAFFMNAQPPQKLDCKGHAIRSFGPSSLSPSDALPQSVYVIVGQL